MSQAARRSHAERTDLSDRRMFEAAVRLIIEKGADKTTLKEVGEAAGYSRGLAGYRFGSKPGLFEFIVHTVGEEWLTDLKRATEGRAGLEAIGAAVDEHCRFCLEAPDAVRAFYILWFESLALDGGEVKRVIASIHERRRRDVIDWIERADYGGPVAPAAVADQFTAAVVGIAYQWLLDPADEARVRSLHEHLKHTMQLYFAEGAAAAPV
ncbi:MAG: TetR/AcrR family transcriptional regulator [Pseudomonadota bacterium]